MMVVLFLASISVAHSLFIETVTLAKILIVLTLTAIVTLVFNMLYTHLLNPCKMNYPESIE